MNATAAHTGDMQGTHNEVGHAARGHAQEDAGRDLHGEPAGARLRAFWRRLPHLVRGQLMPAHGARMVVLQHRRRMRIRSTVGKRTG